VVLIVGLDIGQKALARDLLGSVAEGVLVSLWKGTEMLLKERNAVSTYSNSTVSQPLFPSKAC